jgi:hypothetical protein
MNLVWTDLAAVVALTPKWFTVWSGPRHPHWQLVARYERASIQPNASRQRGTCRPAFPSSRLLKEAQRVSSLLITVRKAIPSGTFRRNQFGMLNTRWLMLAVSCAQETANIVH